MGTKPRVRARMRARVGWATKIEKLEKHLGMEPSDSGASMAQKSSEERVQMAHATLERVVEKHVRRPSSPSSPS